MTTGTIISIVLGIAGIICTYFIARWQMKKNQIYHYFVNSYDIGKGLTEDFPSFTLHYRDEILSDNVKVIKGGFINIGKNDVGDEGKTIDIKVVFPEGFVVKAVKVSSVESGLIIKSYFDEAEKNVIVFSINGLIKSNECFNYTAIIETSEDADVVYSQLRFEHRIKNTNVQNTYIGPVGRYLEKRDALFMLLISLFVLIIIVIVVYLLNPEWLDNFSLNSGKTLSICLLIYFGMPYLMYKGRKRGRIIKALLKKQNNGIQ